MTKFEQLLQEHQQMKATRFQRAAVVNILDQKGSEEPGKPQERHLVSYGRRMGGK